MGVVRYRATAEEDLYEISLFTVEQWNIAQADRYVGGLEEFCELLSDLPLMGRACDEVFEGLRRMEYKSHVVFFFPEENGIRVSRILHKSRSPFGEEFEDE